jgi:uncharacterized protein (TIGR00159 family)
MEHLLPYILADFSVLDIRIWDVLDVLIVAYLMYLIYKLLKGTVAFNIFIGVVLLYVIWWLVRLLDMALLSQLLGGIGAFGVIILIIIFQPEVRRFLLFLGDTTLKGRFTFLNKYFKNVMGDAQQKESQSAYEIASALNWMSKRKTGALLVLAKEGVAETFRNNGTPLKANVSDLLLRSIFTKESPLHDGAALIQNDKIISASVILPVSQNQNLSKELGLRHRAGIGVSESHNVVCFIVSEETGEISMAQKGTLTRKIEKGRLIDLITSSLH